MTIKERAEKWKEKLKTERKVNAGVTLNGDFAKLTIKFLCQRP